MWGGRKDWLISQVPASYSTPRTKHAGHAWCGHLSGLSSSHGRPGPPWICAPATGAPPRDPNSSSTCLTQKCETLVPFLPLQSGNFSCFLPSQNLSFLYLFTWFSQLLMSVKSISVLNSLCLKYRYGFYFPEWIPITWQENIIKTQQR